MEKFNKIFIILLALFSLKVMARDKVLSLCIDKTSLFPYSFPAAKDGQNFDPEGEVAAGTMVVLTKKIMDEAGLKVRFKVLPWKRCLFLNEVGFVDGVVGVSYLKERAKFLDYPVSAKREENPCDSADKLSCITFSFVTFKESENKFQGPLSTIPKPVRSTIGLSIVEDLKRDGLKVILAKKMEVNLARLVHDKNGSVITISEEADKIVSNPVYKDLSKQKRPFLKRSYFLALSKNSKKLKIVDRKKIFEQLKKMNQ